MKNLKLALCVWTLAFTAALQAATIEKVDFPDEIIVDGQKLVLNGGGMRKKKKFFKLWDVYVAGLYIPTKSKDAKAIVDSPAPKVIEMVYVRSVDRETQQEAWKDSFAKVCGADCDAVKDQLKAFNDLMVDMKDRSRMRMTFQKDSVSVDVKGKTEKNALISGEAFRRVLLNLYLGDKSTAPELKPKLLGE
jgi:hypothetical protein